MEFTAPLLGFLGFFTMLGWIVHVVVDGRRRRERIKVFTDFHSRLLDRIGSAKEFGEFLQTDGGVRFLDSLSVEGGGPQLRILRGMQLGIILLCLAGGMLGISTLGTFEVREVFMILGMITLSLAIGFLLSAGVSLGLSRKLGLLSGNEAARPARL